MFTATVCHDCEPDFNSHRLCRSEAVALPFAQIFSRHLLRGLLHRSSTTLENLCANRRLADCSKISPPNCSTTNPGLIFPDGEEVAWVGAARHSRTPPTSAVVTPRPFDCGCAALNNIVSVPLFLGVLEPPRTNWHNKNPLFLPPACPATHGLARLN